MTTNEMYILKAALLAQLEINLTELGYDVNKEKSEVNGDVEILSYEFTGGLNNDNMLATTYFLPTVEENDDTAYLVQSITYRTDIEDETMKGQLLQAISVLNFYVPYGSFVMDPGLEVISFRNVIHFYEGLNIESFAPYMTKEIGSGMAVAGLYAAALNAFIDKTINFEEFLDIVLAYSEKKA